MSEHPTSASIARYAAGDDLPADVLWAVEAHLENCQTCRLRLADVVPPQVTALTEAVWAGLEPAVARAGSEAAVARAGSEAVAGRAGSEVVAGRVRSRSATVWAGSAAVWAWLSARRGVARWATPSLLPWLAMTVLVVLAALSLDGLWSERWTSSAVLLVAPIVPVLGVAAAWSRGMDPAHELVVSTARAGLQLVLRRTLAVLAVVLPGLLLGGWSTGASPAYWLLPCLAVTSVTLALGGVVGVRRAAIVTAASWAVLVIGPAVVVGGVPGVLAPGAAPVWAAVLVGGAAAVFFRSAAYSRL